MIAPVIAPPALGRAALAVVVVLVNIPSLVAISTPSKVELVVIAPVIAPPALGSAALAVVVTAFNSVSVAVTAPSMLGNVVLSTFFIPLIWSSPSETLSPAAGFDELRSSMYLVPVKSSKAIYYSFMLKQLLLLLLPVVCHQRLLNELN